MREPTPIEKRTYNTYLRNHTDLVYKLGKKVFNMDFSMHDFDKFHAEGEKKNLLTLRYIWNQKNYRPSESMIKRFDELVFIHVKQNKHHPEYWDSSVTFEDFYNGECQKTVDCSQMSREAFLELCCDWAAVSITNNQPLMKWFYKTTTGNKPRFSFSDNQTKQFKKNMKMIYDYIQKNDIHYPGKPYTAENNFEEEHINERYQFIESFILMKESRAAMTFRFKTDFDADLFRREIPYIWTYVDCSKPRTVTVYWSCQSDMTDFMNHMSNNTRKLVVDKEVIREEVSSGSFSGFTPENCRGILRPITDDPIKNTIAETDKKSNI